MSEFEVHSSPKLPERVHSFLHDLREAYGNDDLITYGGQHHGDVEVKPVDEKNGEEYVVDFVRRGMQLPLDHDAGRVLTLSENPPHTFIESPPITPIDGVSLAIQRLDADRAVQIVAFPEDKRHMSRIVPIKLYSGIGRRNEQGVITGGVLYRGGVHEVTDAHEKKDAHQLIVFFGNRLDNQRRNAIS